MKNTTINTLTLCGVLVLAGSAGAAAGAFFGYGQGYKQGDFEGRHQASRSAALTVATLMTDGIAVEQTDGSAKTYVLRPVEAATK